MSVNWSCWTNKKRGIAHDPEPEPEPDPEPDPEQEQEQEPDQLSRRGGKD